MIPQNNNSNHILMASAVNQNVPQQIEPPSQEEPSLYDFFNSEDLSDTMIIDNSEGMNRKFLAHKIILASKSSFFRNFLKLDPNAKEITLPPIPSIDYMVLPSEMNNHTPFSLSYGIGVDIIESAIRFLYSDFDFSVLMNGGLSTQTCLRFYACFYALQVSSGMFLVERYILQYFMNSDNCLEVLRIGLQFNNQPFIESSVRLAAERLGKLLKMKDNTFYERILRIPYEGFLKIVSSPELQVESEDIVLSLVHDYIAFQNDVAALKKAQTILALQNQPPQLGDAQPKLAEGQNAEQPAEGDGEPQAEKPEEQKQEDENKEKKEGEENAPPAGSENNQNLQNLEGQPSQEENKQQGEEQKQVKQEEEGINDERIKELLLNIRLGYVSHSVLTHFSEKPVFKNHKEIFFKAISLKLSQYEQNESPRYEGINYNPRESYHHKVSSLNPNVTETNLNIMKSSKFPQNSSSVNPNMLISRFNNNISNNKSNLAQSQFVQDVKSVPIGQSKAINFTYSSDFDENGLLYFLGSRNKTAEFTNPFYLNEVMPFCSSLKTGRVEDLTARLPANTISTDDEKNSFFGFDLGEDRYFLPTCYTLRNRSAPSGILYNWVLEGSNDNKQWYTIDKRIHFSKNSQYNLLLEKEREILRKPSKPSTWGVDTTKLKNTLKTIGIDVLGFRVFRITQLSCNGNNKHEFAIGAIEMYGKGYGMNWEI